MVRGRSENEQEFAGFPQRSWFLRPPHSWDTSGLTTRISCRQTVQVHQVCTFLGSEHEQNPCWVPSDQQLKVRHSGWPDKVWRCINQIVSERYPVHTSLSRLAWMNDMQLQAWLDPGAQTGTSSICRHRFLGYFLC